MNNLLGNLDLYAGRKEVTLKDSTLRDYQNIPELQTNGLNHSRVKFKLEDHRDELGGVKITKSQKFNIPDLKLNRDSSLTSAIKLKMGMRDTDFNTSQNMRLQTLNKMKISQFARDSDSDSDLAQSKGSNLKKCRPLL